MFFEKKKRMMTHAFLNKAEDKDDEILQDLDEALYVVFAPQYAA